METVNIHQAKTNLSKLLSRVELGEEIIISNRGIPIAKLIPFCASPNRRASLGLDRERFIVPKDFNASLPEEIVVSHTDRGEKIRIISVRKATRQEQRFYEQGI